MSDLIESLKHPFKELKGTKNLTLCCVLLSLIVVSSLLSSYISIAVKISFSFIFLSIIGCKYGPLLCGIISAMADIITFISKPLGPYQPLLTLSALIVGVVYGLFLYKNKGTLPRIMIACFVIAIINQFLNTYFISILYGKVFTEFFVLRLPENLIMIPIEIIVIYIVLKRIKI